MLGKTYLSVFTIFSSQIKYLIFFLFHNVFMIFKILVGEDNVLLLDFWVFWFLRVFFFLNILICT